MLGLVAPLTMMRPISRALMLCTSPICFTPLLKNTTPTASIHSAKIKTTKIFVMLQILVTNQFDAEFFHQFLYPRTDERVELMLKFIQRRMRVKLRIAGRQNGQQF